METRIGPTSPRILRTIGEAGYDRTPQPVRDAAHLQDAKLRSEGALMGIAGKPVQVRNPEGAHLESVSGSFMSSAMPVAGFAVIEAAGLAEAIDKVSAHAMCRRLRRRRGVAARDERMRLVETFERKSLHGLSHSTLP